MTVVCASRTPGAAVNTRVVILAARPVGHSRPGVRLVYDDRQAPLAGGEIGRPGHVAAEAHHDLGPHAVEHRPGRPDRVAQPARRLQQGRVSACAAATPAG